MQLGAASVEAREQPEAEAVSESRLIPEASAPAAKASDRKQRAAQARLTDDGAPGAERELRRLGFASRDARFSAHLDLLGIGHFGPVFSAEWGNHNTLLFRVRPMDLGLMSYQSEPGSDDQKFRFGFGVGLGGRHYFYDVGPQRGLFIGGTLEYMNSSVDELVTKQNVTFQIFRPQVEFGHRWVIGHFLVEVDAILFAHYVLGTEKKPIRGTCEGTDCKVHDAAQYVGRLGLLVGWFF